MCNESILLERLRSLEGKPVSCFTLSQSSKISTDPNRALSFPPGKAFSCGGETDFCRVKCYGKKNRFQFKEPQECFLRNWLFLIRSHLQKVSPQELGLILASQIPAEARCFRFFEVGDIPKGPLGKFLVETLVSTVKQRAETRFWGYTRTASYLHLVAPGKLPENLVFWYSADPTTPPDELKLAKSLGFKIAYGPWPHSAPIPQDTFPCPATIRVKGNFFREITDSLGRSKLKQIPGACERCGYCWKGRARKNVLFWEH